LWQRHHAASADVKREFHVFAVGQARISSISRAMDRTRLHTAIPARYVATLSRWWCVDTRFLQYTRDKTAWIALSVAGALIAGFAVTTHREQARRQSLDCLALNVYHEARGEARAGQYAVAEVTMNRVASRRFPDTVCEVVYEQRWDRRRKRHVGAFSWTELEGLPGPSGTEWQRAKEVAEAVYRERHVPRLEGVLHYHAAYLKPSWARGRKPMARIGKHLFYRS
jgi:spore germination cell wall hydrolase CwlJ-like protein